MKIWPFPEVIRDPQIHTEYSTSRESPKSEGSLKQQAYALLIKNGPMNGHEMAQALRVTRIQGGNLLSKLKDQGKAVIIKDRRVNVSPATYRAI